jgi:hypothetical protein
VKKFELVPEGTSWPSGNYRSIAMLPITPERVAAVVEAPLVSGIEPGLGPWEAIGLRLKSGASVELIYYSMAPEPKGVEVRVDQNANFHASLQQVIALFGLPLESLDWVSPLACA